MKKEPSEDRENPPSFFAANGMAGSTEEATVYVDDFDVFVTMMLLEDSPAVLSLDYYAKKSAAPMNGKRKSLHR